MEIESSASNTDYRHYLSEVAILTKAGSLSDANPGIRYLLRDRLGSLATIADKNGISVESHGYDAFGKPRLGNWSDKTPAIHGSGITDRGFTAHEHLDDWQLIHMNGRAYDYSLGRFLSIDPIIQSPGNSQSINPYSYLMNNPLSGTDPSGYCARATGSRICTDRDQVSAPLGNIDNFTEYQRQDGSTFWVATTNGGDQFKVQGFSNVPGSVADAAGLQTDAINGLGAAAAGLSDQNVPDGTVTIGPIQISWNYRDNFFGRMLESGDAASIGVGLSPAGVLADLYTAGTGEDYFTKEEVPGWMRAAVLVPGVSELRKTGRVADAAKATARTAARSLAEKLTMGEAVAGAGRRIMQGRINDPKYPEALWAKMEHVHVNPDGTNTVIHYWQNLATGVGEGFKFK